MSIVQKEFIRRVLQDEANRFEKNQGLQMKKLLHFHTGSLFNDRSFTVRSDSLSGGALSVRHTNYQRFLDIKRKRRSKKSGRLSNKNYPIHNQFVFGHYNSIASRLMFDLTDEVAAGIRRDLIKK